jgi:hypothetical protein
LEVKSQYLHPSADTLAQSRKLDCDAKPARILAVQQSVMFEIARLAEPRAELEQRRVTYRKDLRREQETAPTSMRTPAPRNPLSAS